MSDEPNDELKQPARIDPSLDSYITFFDHDWSQRMMTLVQKSKIERPAFALVVNWKGIANTHRFPWLLIEHLRSFWHGIELADTNTSRILSLLAQRIPAKMGDRLSNMKRQQLAQVIREMTDEIAEAVQLHKPFFDFDAMWRHYTDPTQPGSNEFVVAIWASQRICFGALYHNYENFVRQCVGLAKGEPNYRVFKFKILTADFTALFGEVFANDCLGGYVNTARLVRNALAHNGGIVSAELRKQHDFAIDEDVVQIIASDTRRLFDTLKDRSYAIAERILSVLGCV